MRKKTNRYAWLLMFSGSLLATSCDREVEDRLPGEWSYSDTRITEVTYNGVNSSETTNAAGTINFDKDKSGTLATDNGTSEFTWETSADSVHITTNGATSSYSIVDNSKSRQEWENITTESDSNYTFTTTTSITLTQ